MEYRISEIFYSIQGEGVNQGLPTVFVRLFGCNLFPKKCCRWCDTTYAQGKVGRYELLSVEEILRRVVELSPWVDTRICITGGEPLAAEGIEGLVSRLRKCSYYIEVFTNGTVQRPKWWTKVDSWITDIKCPSSGVPQELIQWGWLDGRSLDQVKLTIADEEDLKFASAVIARCATKNPQVLVSPVFNIERDLHSTDRKWMQEVVKFCLDRKVRISLQQHKIIWGNKKGV